MTNQPKLPPALPNHRPVPAACLTLGFWPALARGVIIVTVVALAVATLLLDGGDALGKTAMVCMPLNLLVGIVGLWRERHRLQPGRPYLAVAVVLGLIVPFYSALAGGDPLRAKEQVKRAKCFDKLRCIGMVASGYAKTHGGRYPDRLEDLLLGEERLIPDALVCPSSGDTAAAGATTQAMLADFGNGGHCSYIYLGQGMTIGKATDSTVIAYERLAHHKDGGNVLFGDGHVEWATAARLQAYSSATRPTTGP